MTSRVYTLSTTMGLWEKRTWYEMPISLTLTKDLPLQCSRLGRNGVNDLTISRTCSLPAAVATECPLIQAKTRNMENTVRVILYASLYGKNESGQHRSQLSHVKDAQPVSCAMSNVLSNQPSYRASSFELRASIPIKTRKSQGWRHSCPVLIVTADG